jgi:zinc protease
MSRRAEVPRRVGLVLGLAFLTMFAAMGETVAAHPPVRKALANGLTLVYQYDASSPLTALSLLIKGGGQAAEPEGLAGLSFLTTRLLLEIPDSQSARNLMRQSSTAGMTCRGDFSLISLECLSDNFEDLLRTMAEPLLHPLFSSVRVDNIKAGMLHQGNLLNDDAVLAGHAAQARAFFGNSGYGASVYGSQESLKSLKSKQAEDFYRARFRAENVILALVTDLEEGAAASLLQKYLTPFPTGATNPAMAPGTGPKPAPAAAKKEYIAKKTVQTFMSYGFRLPGLSARGYALTSLVENILGKGIGSRLWPLRQTERLAYNVDADALLMKDAGLLEVYLETDEGSCAPALQGLTRVVTDLWSQGAGNEELAAAKAMALANLLRDNEARDSRCSNMAFWECQGLGADFLQRLPTEIEAVTLAEVNDYIRAVLDPDKAHLVIVGPGDVAVIPPLR